MRFVSSGRRASAFIAAALAISTMGAPMAQAVSDAAAPAMAGPAVLSALNAQTGLIETTIPHTRHQLEGATQNAYDGNFFEFSKNGGWSIGQGGTEEHYWSKNPANAEQARTDLWYEVEFEGSSIDIYSGKNRMMGKVKYTVDGKPEHSIEGDLYNPVNQTCEFIGTIDNLGEGRHTLRAEATGTKNDKSTGYTMDCAKVVVDHAPYEPTALELSSETPGFDTDEAEGAHLHLKEAGTTDLQLTVEPDYVSDQDLSFSSSNDAVATVDANGLVTAVAGGEATITVAPKAAVGGKAAAKAIEIPVHVAEAPLIDGFISDVDTQWTQDRYAEAIGEIEQNDAEAPSGKKAARVAESDDTGKLSAWKNDAAISEITLASAGKEVKNVTVEATDFTADGGKTIAAENVELSFIGSTKAYNGSFLGYGNQPNAYPQPTEQNRSESNDILLGSDPVAIGSGKLQNVFVKINVPKDAEPGDYTGTVKVSADGLEAPLEFAYSLTVQDAMLPDVTDFGKTFDAELWQYPYSSAEYYGVEPFSSEHLEILKPIMELYKSIGGHAITTTIVEEAWSGQTYADADADGGHDDKIHYPSMVRWQLDENGVMTYDFSDFDAWVEFNQELGIGDKIVLYSIAPWHNSIKYYDAEGNLQTVDASKVGQAEGNRYWRHFLEALIDHLEEKGWFDMAYMAIDERGITHEAFDMVESVKNSEGESLKTAGAMDRIKGDDRVALAMRIDDLNIGDFAAQDATEGYDELLKKRSEAGLRTTLYSCTEHYPGNFSLSNPVESYWSIINAEKDGNTAGFLRWAYDAWVDDPLNDATHWAFEAGDCFLIYPGADKATVEAAKAEGRELTSAEKTAKSSIRLERMAEGLRDANKIKKMRAEVTDMTDDIQKVYDKITRVAAKRTNRDWTKVDQEMAVLDQEMSQFKLDLVTLTDQYIAERSGAPAKLAITGGDSVEAGKTIKLDVTSNTASRGVKWTASNSDIAVVASDGTVTGKKPGVCKITATSLLDEGVSTSKTIVVTEAQVEIPKVDVTDAQVAHYAFEDNVKDDWTAGTTRAGEGAQDGTVKGDVSYENGKDGKGVHVNAAENKTVSLPDDQFNLDGAKDWTVGYWVKSNSSMDSQNLPLIDEDANYAFALRLGDNSTRANPGFRVGPNDGDVLSFGPVGHFKPNTWYRVAWVQDADQGLRMYVNGEQVGDLNTWTKNNSAKIKVPVDVIGGNGFNGIIDELAIYDRALTKDEVLAQMHEFTGEEAQGEGLGLEFTEKVIYEGESFGISGNLAADASFEVKDQQNIADDAKAIEDHDVISVTEDGVVTGELRGSAVVTVTSGGQSEDIEVTVKRNVVVSNNLSPILVDQSEEAGFISDIYDPRDDGNFQAGKKYYGQPDMVRVTKGEHAGRLITAFPQGHGHGPLVTMYSDDEGSTWKKAEELGVDIPSDWAGSQETPTMYVLELPDGTERIMLITACPGWGTDSDGNKYGWNTSYSDDGGETWSDYKHWYSTMDGQPGGANNPAVVGMASLVQLHDETGKPKNEWMGIFHHQGDFTNYKTILSFDKKDGEWVESWSAPEKLFTAEQHEIERTLQMCEIGMFRSPDGERIVGLVRSQSHNHLSTMIYSDDEGKTWSDPVELPGSLAGERHKALYDPVSGKLVITFREMNFDRDYDNKIEGGNDWICESWGMWVGTYEQLMNQEDGEYRFRLSEDWSGIAVPGHKRGDTGYTGMTVSPDGTFVFDTYGHWDKDESMKETSNIRVDLSYIRQAKFTLNDLLVHHGLPVSQTPLNVNVTFDYNYEGAEDTVETVAVGETVAEPAAPVREGFKFGGWFTSEDCAEGAAFDFSVPVSDNLTLYAKWTEVSDPGVIEFFATFHLNYEGAPSMGPVKVVDGKVPAPADPTREGYSFGGWYAEAACENEFDFDSVVEGNVALYAKWVKDDVPVDPENPGGGEQGGQGGEQGGQGANKPGGPGADAKPGGGLPGTGDGSLALVGGLAAAGALTLGGASVLSRRRKDR